jgi:hypothetical protein
LSARSLACLLLLSAIVIGSTRWRDEDFAVEDHDGTGFQNGKGQEIFSMDGNPASARTGVLHTYL